MITTVLFHHFKLQYLKGIFKKSNSPEIIAHIEVYPKQITKLFNVHCEKSFFPNAFLDNKYCLMN